MFQVGMFSFFLGGGGGEDDANIINGEASDHINDFSPGRPK